MKEFIKKMIERMREKSFYMQTNRNRQEKFIHTETVTEIVNELAEEYNNDFCEWKFDTTGIVWNCNGCETYNLPYAMSLRIIADDFECKCPYCGKKIKVVK